MRNNSRLLYINIIALIAMILLTVVLILFFFNGMFVGLLLATFETLKTYLLAFIALVFIGFYVLFIANYSSAQGKSGWLFLIATMIFLPISLCLIGLALTLLYTK
jgi:hypothetical protein